VESAIGRSYWFAEIIISISHLAKNASSEESFLTPIDTKVSIDTIVQ
jgi:hypothetical protein